jgi:N-acetylglucosamine malate deacetylase 1
MLKFMHWRSAKQIKHLPLIAFPKPLSLEKAKRVLVFAPHPDDETIGCGGTLSLLSTRCDIRIVLVTDGGGAGWLPDGTQHVRLAEFRRAIKELGVTDFIELHQPDGAFSATPSLLNQVKQVLKEFEPNWVFLPSPFDYHRDHLRIASAFAPLCMNHSSIEYLLFYETWAPVPATHIVDITSSQETKHRALEHHVTALAHGDYMKAIDGLNRYRGIYLGKGKSAEAFWVESPDTGSSLFLRLRDICLEIIGRLARSIP